MEEDKTKTPFYKKWWFWLIIIVVGVAIIGGVGGGIAGDGNSDLGGNIEERNALKSAKLYLNSQAFSYEGLIDQLEFEGYSENACKYAVDNCGANWFEQAARCARSYLNVMPFSRSELIRQLEFEKFTHEQAVYGVEANGY